MREKRVPSWLTALALLLAGWVLGWALYTDPVAALYAQEVWRLQTMARPDVGKVRVELWPVGVRDGGSGEVWLSGMPVGMLVDYLDLEIDPEEIVQVDARPWGGGQVRLVAYYGGRRQETVLEPRNGLMTWWWEKGP
ncbi:MAG: hypothetical protein QJR00_00605 [Bacillota bacterium]|nr:hypothetical protein [Bacillota bacterium]